MRYGYEYIACCNCDHDSGVMDSGRAVVLVFGEAICVDRFVVARCVGV